MKSVKNLCAMLTLTAALCLQVSAGQIEAPPAAPAPTRQTQCVGSEEGRQVLNEEQNDSLMGVAIQIVMTFLSIN